GVAYGIYRGVQWIRRHLRTREGVVQQRALLRGVILPAILSTITTVGNFIQDIANRITGALGRVMEGINQLTGAVASTPLLRMAAPVVNFIADGFRGLLGWANEGVQGVANWLKNGLAGLGRFAIKLVDFLEGVGEVIRDMLRLTYFLAGR